MMKPPVDPQISLTNSSEQASSVPYGTVAITGAAGRIGRLLCEKLGDIGHDVRALDVLPNPGNLPDYRQGDICDLAGMVEALTGVDAVIHLAATPNARPGWPVVCDLNITGTRTVLEASRRKGVGRVVFASSIHTVGAHPADSPLTPALCDLPSGIYGVSKIAAESLCDLYARHSPMTCLSVRICSFRPKPEDRRELRTWLGYDDCVHLFDRCLRGPTQGHQRLWGVSANKDLSIDDPVARGLGYVPQQDADNWRDELFRQGLLDHDAGLWPTLGGPVTEATVAAFS